MDFRSLSNILGILRLIKDNPDPNRPTSQLIRIWAGSDIRAIGEPEVLKVASYIQEQVEEAKLVIENSQLPEEAKHGVQETLQAVGNAFSLAGIQAQPQQHLGNLKSAISSLVILLGASGVNTQLETPEEAVDLARDVEALISDFDDPGLDPLVREIAKQHLQILATLLRHVPVFGLEAAMTTYFEMVVKMRRADASTRPEQKKKVEPLMERINGWGTKFSKLDQVWNVGARWIGHGKVALSLLGFIDPSS